MIIALLVGRGGSVGFPNKNVYPVLKRPLMSYPLLAAQNSKFVDDVYVSTDSKAIEEVGIKFGAKIIKRPAELATSEAVLEDTFLHAYKFIKDQLNILAFDSNNSSSCRLLPFYRAKVKIKNEVVPIGLKLNVWQEVFI